MMNVHSSAKSIFDVDNSIDAIKNVEGAGVKLKSFQDVLD
jgi:hypothetical protein